MTIGFFFGVFCGFIFCYLINKKQIKTAEDVPNLREKIILLENQAISEREILKHKIETLESIDKKLSETFRALSSDALKSNNQMFLDLAQSVFKEQTEKTTHEFDKKQFVLSELVKPIQSNLESFNQNVLALEKSREGAYNSLLEQVKHLSSANTRLEQEASHLAKVFRDPNAKGQWGELHLRRTVECAGMLPYVDFEEQSQATDGYSSDKKYQPDMIIKLPNDRRIIIDAKFPGVQKYLEATNDQNDETRKSKLAIYCKQLRECMQKLSQKQYFSQFDFTPEFVVLFLPSEALLSVALQEDSGLIEYSSQQNVILATPIILIALLKTIAYGWKQEQLAKEAKNICDLGSELSERMLVFYNYFEDMRNQLSKTVDIYNKITSSFESRLIPTANKLQSLLYLKNDPMNPIEPIEKTLKILK